jgi:hypothetical protein
VHISIKLHIDTHIQIYMYIKLIHRDIKLSNITFPLSPYKLKKIEIQKKLKNSLSQTILPFREQNSVYGNDDNDYNGDNNDNNVDNNNYNDNNNHYDNNNDDDYGNDNGLYIEKDDRGEYNGGGGYWNDRHEVYIQINILCINMSRYQYFRLHLNSYVCVYLHIYLYVYLHVYELHYRLKVEMCGSM